MKLVPLLFLTVSHLALATTHEPSSPIEPPMVTIPSGSYLMGYEIGKENEQPVRKTNVDAFMMGKYEVTIAEFRRFVEATNYPMSTTCVHEAGPYWFLRPVTFSQNETVTQSTQLELAVTKGSWDNNSISKSEYEPVVCVGWNAANAYANWLAKKTGKPYRLPTEAEWEYAHRAGTTTTYFFGETNDLKQVCQYANVADKYGEEVAGKRFNAGYGGRPDACNDRSGLVSIVGLYQPNPFGLFDTTGNVEEWVQDCFIENNDLTTSNEPSTATQAPTSECKQRVVRGGSWHYFTYTASQRTGLDQNDFIGVLEGFRLALDAQNLPPAKSTLNFERQLKKAQQQEKQKMAALLDFPAKPSGLKVTVNNQNKVVLSWDKSIGSATTGYDIYRSSSYFTENDKIANNVNTTEFIDDVVSDGRLHYRIKATNKQRTSEWSETVAIGQSQIHSLPGRIQAEAYHFAPDSVIAASVSEPEGDRGYLRISDSKAEYQLTTTTNGSYELQLRVFNDGQAQPFELWLGQELITSITPTGKRGWQTVTKPDIHLTRGEHTLSVRAKSQNFALNWLQFNKL